MANNKNSIRVYDLVGYHPVVDVDFNIVENDLYDKSGAIMMPDKLRITAEVSHTGFVNENYYYYHTDDAEKAVKSFTKDYNKPVLKHHNSGWFCGSAGTDPIGRVIDAWYERKRKRRRGNEPMGAIVAKMEISDRDAIEKILDKRLSTFSIRASAKDVKCSICEESPDDCEHIRGEHYGDKKDNLCYWIINNYSYREVSFVNIPSDTHTNIRATDTSDNLHDDECGELGCNMTILLDSLVFEDTNSSIDDKNAKKDGKISKDQRNQLETVEEDMDEKYKELYDKTIKALEVNEKTLEDVSEENSTLKTKVEVLDKQLSDKSKETEDLKKDLNEKIKRVEESEEETKAAIDGAREFILEKIFDLKTELGYEITDNVRSEYKDMSVSDLRAVRKELEKLAEMKALVDSNTNGSDNSDEDPVNVLNS